MSYQVFISYKKSHQSKTLIPDAVVAEKLYKLLRDNNVEAFYSEKSLEECGAGQFSRAIEKALDEAKVLVLVGSCRENIESRWVEAEWDSFLNDVRSGHKEGHLFIVNCGTMKPSELPLFLRRQQMFREDELSRLLQFVLNALPDSPTLDDVIRGSLHCFRPEKNEDKIYLWTAHKSPQGSGIMVTAHWGPRNAKRLNSQVKKTDLTNEDEVAAFVNSEKRQKMKPSEGYRPKAYSKLLTAEARSLLCAALGLNVADKRPQTQKRVAKVVQSSPRPKKSPTKTPKASAKKRR
jgi:hypothetical protein